MMKDVNTELYQDAFHGMQSQLDQEIVVSSVYPGVLDVLNQDTIWQPIRNGFSEASVQPSDFRVQGRAQSLLGRIILVQNAKLQAFSPAIVLPSPTMEGVDITMLDQQYDPRVGLSAGIHFGLSAHSQTVSSNFGEHSSAAVYEAGHFSTLLLGSRDPTLGDSLRRLGDIASDTMIESGVATTMSLQGTIPVRYKTAQVGFSNPAAMKLYWHHSLETDSGPASGDFENTVQLLLGAGFRALGRTGIDDVRRLADSVKVG